MPSQPTTLGRLVQLIESNMRVSPTGAKVLLAHSTNLFWTAAACIVMGLAFAIWGSFDTSRFGIVVVAGVVLLAWGVFQAVQAFRVRGVARRT